MVLQNCQKLILMASNMIYIVALSGGLKCPHKIDLRGGVTIAPFSHGSAVSRRKIVKLDLRASHANWRWLLMGMKMQFSKWTTYFLEALWGGINYFTIFSLRKGFLIKSAKVPLIKRISYHLLFASEEKQTKKQTFILWFRKFVKQKKSWIQDWLSSINLSTCDEQDHVMEWNKIVINLLKVLRHLYVFFI